MPVHPGQHAADQVVWAALVSPACEGSRPDLSTVEARWSVSTALGFFSMAQTLTLQPVASPAQAHPSTSQSLGCIAGRAGHMESTATCYMAMQ